MHSGSIIVMDDLILSYITGAGGDHGAGKICKCREISVSSGVHLLRAKSIAPARAMDFVRASLARVHGASTGRGGDRGRHGPRL
jgi:hypothetical protein